MAVDRRRVGKLGNYAHGGFSLADAADLSMQPWNATNADMLLAILSRLAQSLYLWLFYCSLLCQRNRINNMKLLTLTLAAAATASSIPAAALSGCSKSRACNSQSSGEVNNITITSGQRQRSFLLWIPSSYQSNKPTAAILSYHGGNDDATDQLELDKLTDPEFNTESIVVYPQGINVSASARHL